MLPWLRPQTTHCYRECSVLIFCQSLLTTTPSICQTLYSIFNITGLPLERKIWHGSLQNPVQSPLAGPGRKAGRTGSCNTNDLRPQRQNMVCQGTGSCQSSPLALLKSPLPSESLTLCLSRLQRKNTSL